jgi:glyoxylase-like metal-dependent hydrolase (beta-lactamase superfamily II)
MMATVSADSLTVGNVEVLVCTDVEATLPFPLDQVFPGVAAERWAPHRERFPAAFAPPNHWRVHCGGTLVRSGGRTILVDTGMGPDPIEPLGSGPGALPDAIRGHGVAMDEIDTVFLTHAHIDHIGWNSGRNGTPTFPRARYALHRADWDAMHALEAGMTAIGIAPYVGRLLTPLQTLGVLDLLEDETPLTPEVIAIHTPGHTPGSMSLLISSAGEKAIIPGDVLVHPAQVSEPDWVFSFDSDGAQAVATRADLLDRIEAEGMTLASCHFPHPGYGRVIRLEGRRYWQAL